MKKKVHYFKLLLLLFGIIPCAHSQWQNGLWTEKQAYNWPFAQGLKLDFNTTPPTVGTSAVGDQHNAVGQSLSNGAISDQNGNLLIYNGPENVWPFHMFNGNNTIMPNGSSLASNPLQSQTGIIIPRPQHPNIYYVFTQSFSDNNSSFASESGLYYSVVDMSLDGGLGDVTVKNDTLSQLAGDFQTAVHHANQKDVWLIANRGGANSSPSYTVDENGELVPIPGGAVNTNQYMAFLITEDGIETEPVISSVGDTISVNRGQMKASPNGTKIAVANVGYPNRTSQVFDFNTSTGELTNPINLSSVLGFLGVLGIEFSPNSRFLYVAEAGLGADFSKISQFDLEAGDESDILASQIILYQELAPFTAGMQIGPDGKIYVISQQFVISQQAVHSTGVSTINYPNNKGEAADFELFSTITPFEDAENPDNNVIAGPSFPGFIQSFFESGILHERDGECPNEAITFSTIRIPGIETIAWDYGDGQTGTGLTSSHSYAQGGSYMVTATITSNGAQQTATTEIIVLPAPIAVVPDAEALSKCADGSGNATFDLAGLDAAILDGQSPDQYTVAYYLSPEDIEAGTAIGTPDEFVTSGQLLYAVVTNNTVPGCPATIQFDVVVLAQPSFPGISTFQGCSPFNLVSIVGAPGADTTYSFHASEQEALDDTGALATPTAYIVTGNAGSIYIRATGATGCVQVGELLLEAGNCMIPRGISPNGDGDNDSFDLSGFGVRKLSIFNRYGTKVYSRMDYTNQWSGQSDNGHELPTGTYFYVVEAGQDGNKTGWVYINR